MNKRGISPLISTLILIVLAIGVGVLVMNFGRAQLEANSKCAIDTEMRLIELNSVPQLCFSGSGSDGFLKFILENGVNTDISSVHLRVIGSSQPFELSLDDSFVESGYSLQKIVPYNFDIFGRIKQVRLTPRVLIFSGNPPILCPDQSIVINDVPEC